MELSPNPVSPKPDSSSCLNDGRSHASEVSGQRQFAATGLIGGLLVAAFVLGAAEKFKLPPETSGFKAGPGAELAMGQCVLCHSADYISTQPRMSRAAWKASVQKMREKYGAPLPEEQVERLVDYLVKTYGAETPKQTSN